MSRTYRKQPLRNQFRHPKTLNELRQVSDDYNDTQYPVSTRNRYIPTAYDDITATSIYQNDHHHVNDPHSNTRTHHS
jgi:hypothetical protein